MSEFIAIPYEKLSQVPQWDAVATALMKLEDAKHEAYVVGGFVRDLLCAEYFAKPLTKFDIDIATSATPEEVMQILGGDLVGQKFGVVITSVGEVATFRKEGVYTDNRHPDNVTFGSFEEDWKRRDFTMNCIYMDRKGRIVDPSELGVRDIQSRWIRAVGNAENRIKEDYVRILRAIRFHFTSGFTMMITNELMEAMEKYIDQCANAPIERINTELDKCIERAAFDLEYLEPNTKIQNLLNKIIPNLANVMIDALRYNLLCERHGMKSTLDSSWGMGWAGTNMGFDAICDGLKYSNARRKAVRYAKALRYYAYHWSGVPEWIKTRLWRTGDIALLQYFRPGIIQIIEKWKEEAYIISYPSEVGDTQNTWVNGDELTAMGYKPGKEFAQTLTILKILRESGAIVTKEQSLKAARTLMGYLSGRYAKYGETEDEISEDDRTESEGGTLSGKGSDDPGPLQLFE